MHGCAFHRELKGVVEEIEVKASGPGMVVGLGELLWDMLPGGKQLGGAPANFAYISSLLGNRSVVASRVGNDEAGIEARKRVRDLGLDTGYVQVDPEHPTGRVNVTVDSAGQPDFTIAENAAWDFIEYNLHLQFLAGKADIVCFGSLAQRAEISRSTIQQFLRNTRESCLRIFDVNLRQNYYSPVILKTGFALATVVKMNNSELPVVMAAIGQASSDDEQADAELLLNHYGLELVCVTRGANGSILVSRNGKSDHSGFRVKVVDTVGSGDAFTATLAHGCRLGLPLDAINEAANRMGGWVASQPGATPSGLPDELLRAVAAR
jgi:fructokinase